MTVGRTLSYTLSSGQPFGQEVLDAAKAALRDLHYVDLSTVTFKAEGGHKATMTFSVDATQRDAAAITTDRLRRRLAGPFQMVRITCSSS
jgi:hypothetical protein